MGQKSIVNDTFNLFRALGSVRNGFVFEFLRKSWYREVEGSFLSLFHGHFCFSRVRTISLPGCICGQILDKRRVILSPAAISWLVVTAGFTSFLCFFNCSSANSKRYRVSNAFALIVASVFLVVLSALAFFLAFLRFLSLPMPS